jgi:hypothetical protein
LPKSHDQLVRSPVDVSVKETLAPCAGASGLKVNEAAGGAGRTTSVRVLVTVPATFVADSVTEYVPGRSKTWLGLASDELAVSSPNVHDRDAIGPPVDVSVNWTTSPARGAVGAIVNDGMGGGMLATTVTVRDAVFVPTAFVAVRRTA